MTRYAVVARFFLDVDGDLPEATRKLSRVLEGVGAKHIRSNPHALSLMPVNATAPRTAPETKSERRERYLRRKAEREEARRRNGEA